jgi:hypothetical protein
VQNLADEDNGTMNSAPARIARQDDLKELMAPIVSVAAAHLMELSEAKFEFVPDYARSGIAAVYRRLRDEVKGLLALCTVHGDLVACRMTAQEFPWHDDELSRSQHLKLAWSRFRRLAAIFESELKAVCECHKEAVMMFSVDAEVPEAETYLGPTSPPSDGYVGGRSGSRWDEEAPDPACATAYADMTVGCERRDTHPSLGGSYEEARDELLGEIDAQIETVRETIRGVLRDHAAALGGLIERFNDMVRNFRELDEKKSR